MPLEDEDPSYVLTHSVAAASLQLYPCSPPPKQNHCPTHTFLESNKHYFKENVILITKVTGDPFLVDELRFPRGRGIQRSTEKEVGGWL